MIYVPTFIDSILSSLPVWTAARSATSSMYNRYLTAVTMPSLFVEEDMLDATKNLSLSRHLRSEDSNIWRVKKGAIQEVKEVSVLGSVIRRADSVYDFWNSNDAAWIETRVNQDFAISSQSEEIYLRNLDVVTSSITTTGDAYVVVATNADLVEDSPVWFYIPTSIDENLPSDYTWVKLDYSETTLSGTNRMIWAPLPSSVNSTTFKYRSNTLHTTVAASGEALVNGSTYTLEQISLYNNSDVLAAILGKKRYSDESNADLLDELENSSLSQLFTCQDLGTMISNGVRLMSVLVWDPYTDTTISMPASTESVFIVGLNQVDSVTEVLTNTDDEPRYVLQTKRTPDLGYNIVVGNILQEDITISDGEFTLSSIPVSNVIVKYSATNYTTTEVAGYITSVTAVSGNIPNDTFYIVATSYVSIESLYDSYEDYNMQSFGINMLGKVKWKDSSSWFTDLTLSPPIDNIPTNLE